MIHLGLRGKILTIVGGICLVALGVVSLSASYFYSAQQAELMRSRSQAIAKGLSLQLERIVLLGIPLEELQGFEEQCQETLKVYDGLAYAMVVSKGGLLLFHSNPYIQRLSAAPAAIISRHGTTASFELPESNSIATMVPVMNPRGLPVADVVIGTSRNTFIRERNHSLTLTLGIGGACLALGMILLYLALSCYVIRPISGFMDSIAEIRSGHSSRIQWHTTQHPEDEFGLLVRSFNTLLEQLAQHKQDLLEAKDQSDAASKAKSHFLAVMSHEIRTPIHAMLGMNELLQQSQLDSRQSRYTQRIEVAGHTLLNIVNDILDFSRIEAGQPMLEPRLFHLRTTLETTIDLLQEIATQKGLTLQLHCANRLPEMVYGDAGRLGQILTNLVHNAIKFTASGIIDIQVSPGQDNFIHFSVQDTGIGIQADFLQSIFEPFSQADASFSRRYGGTGLGLSIVKQLVDLMDGRLGVESTAGQGSTFWFDIPLPTQEASQEDRHQAC